MTNKELIKYYKDYNARYAKLCECIYDCKVANNMKHYATLIKIRFAMKTIIECIEKIAKLEGIEL